MPELNNLSQFIPEVPNAAAPPQEVLEIQQDTPFMTSPVGPAVLTSRKARDITKRNLEELSMLTGRQYNL